MKASEIKEKYSQIKYIASDGKTYKLVDKYPLCLLIENSKDTVFLDTGGEMQDCMFFEAKIEDNYLYAIMPENNNIPKKIARIIF